MLEETLTKNMHLQKVRDYYIQRYEQETTEYVGRNTHQEYAFTKGKRLFQFEVCNMNSNACCFFIDLQVVLCSW